MPTFRSAPQGGEMIKEGPIFKAGKSSSKFRER